jgi:GT2 family glycosyltransferase
MTPADVTVVLACHTQDRWASIVAAVESVRAQSTPVGNIVIAVDHNPTLAGMLRAELPDVLVVLNDSPDRGASATRNAGAATVTTSLTAFLDDDETAAADWIDRLITPFADPAVAGTGGCYRPRWLAGKPPWFPDEFAWAVGGSYTGMPTQTSPVRNVWSGNMAVRTKAFQGIGGFRSGFGKLAGRSRPEDTDLCIRLGTATGKQWMYVPDAVIDHEVPGDRSTFRFFVGRSFAEGRGKIEMKRQLAGKDTLDAEGDYLRRTIPQGLINHVRSGHFSRAAALFIGVVAAAIGAAVGLAVDSVAATPPVPAGDQAGSRITEESAA